MRNQKGFIPILILIGIIVVIVFFLFLGAIDEPEQVTDRGQDLISIQSDVHLAGQKVEVGKSIWKLLGAVKDGNVWQLPQGNKLGTISYRSPTQGTLIGIVLDFVNFSDLPFTDFAGTGGTFEATLVDDKGREFKPLSYDKATAMISASEEKKLGSYVEPLLKNPWDSPVVYLYVVPDDGQGFKVKVRDETKHSNQKTLISFEIPRSGDNQIRTETPSLVSKEQSITPAPSNYALNEPAIVDGVQFTVVEYKTAKECHDKYQSQYQGPKQAAEGAKFLLLKVRAENIDEVAKKLPSHGGTTIYLKYKGERIWGSVACFIENAYRSSVDEKVYPGVSREGWLLYEIPENLDLSLTYAAVMFSLDNEILWKLSR